MEKLTLNTDFEAMKMVQLREIAKEMKIWKWHSMRKRELIESILFDLKNEGTEFVMNKKCSAMCIKGTKTMKCSKIAKENCDFCDEHMHQYRLEKPCECPICFDGLEKGEIPLSCGHWFHKDCLKKTEKNSCPVCRKLMTKNEMKFK